MRRCILVDLDHTISASWPRDTIIANGGTWDDWNADRHFDEVIHDVVLLLHALNGFVLDSKLILLTAVNERWRQKVFSWLLDNSVPIDEIIMRPDNDFSQDADCKYNLALKRFGSDECIRQNVWMILDDNESVIEKFSNVGVTALRVFARKD